MRWGDDWEGDDTEPPAKLIHVDCGHATHPVLDCAHCGDHLTLRNVYVDPVRIGPYAGKQAVSAPG
jgi:hypothetical protein